MLYKSNERPNDYIMPFHDNQYPFIFLLYNFITQQMKKIALSQLSITHRILIPDEPALTRPNMP